MASTHSRKRKPLLCFWCPEPGHSPVPPSLLGELVLLIPLREHRAPAQSHPLHLFPNAHSFPKLWGNFTRMKEHPAQHSICSSTFQSLARAWRNSSSPTSYKLLNYSFISYGHPSQVSPKENPPQDTSPVRGCWDHCCGSRKRPGAAGHLTKGTQGISWSKDQALICCASTEQCAGGASSHPLESRAVLPILPSLSPWLWVKQQGWVPREHPTGQEPPCSLLLGQNHGKESWSGQK